MSDSIYQVSTDVLIEPPILKSLELDLSILQPYCGWFTISKSLLFLDYCQERTWRSVNHIMALANFITDAAFCLGCVHKELDN